MKKILMVDDDVDLIEQFKPVFEQAGYEFAAAYNSREGLETFKKFEPDAMIVDLSMEHFDSGFVLCHRIKATERGQAIPVIIMTSAGQDTGYRFGTDTAEEKNWIKADDYLEKPISPRDLVQYLGEKIFKA
ncbi:response regulator [candidate division KSB1 bacterium]|nr:response regulator [candidate division KSB1 bacterium]RQW00923.1 MAG: response regulator [candidate division KSB1 bacterium]